MATSPAQHAANILNAQNSTGPSTPEGKKRSSLNAFRHGFTGQVLVLTEADAPVYQKHCRDYHSQFEPTGKLEIDLVQELADLRWAINRMRATETNLHALEAVSHTLTIETGDPIINASLALAQSLRDNVQAFTNLALYEGRKLRAFDHALLQLTELQKERKAAQQTAVSQASAFRHILDEPGEPWDPKADGFVCTLQQIDDYLALQARSKFLQKRLREIGNEDRRAVASAAR